MVPQLRKVKYEDRRKAFGIQSLSDRRSRGDLIEMFKIVNNLDIVNWTNPPIFNNSRTIEGGNRNHEFRYVREYAARSSARHNFFLNRVSQQWNRLNYNTVKAPTVNNFKNRIDKIY